MNLLKTALPAALLLFLPSFVAADVLLTASASPNPVAVGGATNVTVTLSDNLGPNAVSGFQFDLDFNPAVLQAMSVTEEGYFANNGVTGFTTVTINNTAGTILLIEDAAATPEDPGSGDPLASIAFSAANAGASPITIANALISGGQLNQIASSDVNTTVNVTGSVPEPASFLLAGAGLLLALFRIVSRRRAL